MITIPPAFTATLHPKLSELSIPSERITQFFDARGMSCPMPLLKAKVALRSVANGDALYLLASDKNSQTDLIAFCHKQAHTVHSWHTDSGDDGSIYHFIILKTA